MLQVIINIKLLLILVGHTKIHMKQGDALAVCHVHVVAVLVYVVGVLAACVVYLVYHSSCYVQVYSQNVCMHDSFYILIYLRAYTLHTHILPHNHHVCYA